MEVKIWKILKSDDKTSSVFFLLSIYMLKSGKLARLKEPPSGPRSVSLRLDVELSNFQGSEENIAYVCASTSHESRVAVNRK